jgi:SNF2 family DNA or RNA helicase
MSKVPVIKSGADFVIINYDGVEVVLDEIINGGFDLVIIDEATHYKNVHTTRWKTLNKIVKPDTWLWLMTGTPAAQGPVDAYGLAKLVNPSGVPRYFGTFRDMVMRKVTQFKWEPKPTATDVVFNALQPAIRFTKEQCLDLPDLVYTKRDVDMTPQQMKYYNQLRTQMYMGLSSAAGVSAVNAAVMMNKLLQISAGAVYTDDGDAVQFDITKRYNVLKEVIAESSQKVLIFVPFRHVIDVLSAKLRADGISAEVIRGDGDVSKSNRTPVPKNCLTRVLKCTR